MLVILTPSRSYAAGGPGDYWPQWRGPTGQGLAVPDDLPTEWSPTRHVAWSTPIPGRGASSPIVWNDRVFLTTAIEGDVIPDAKPIQHMLADGEKYIHPDSVGSNHRHTLKVLCLDRRTGAILWERTAYEGPVSDDRHRKASYASATPATDGRRVYAWFGSQGLYCYDFSGRLLWKKSLGTINSIGMGTGTSPVLHRNLVILQCDEENGKHSFIIGLDAKSGAEVWRTPRAVEASWSTPVIAETVTQPPVRPRTELIASGNEHVIAYDPRTGRELWRVKGTGSYTVSTPVVGHGIVVASASHPVKRAVAVRLGGHGDITGTPQVVWERDRGTGYTPSSIVYGDYMYLMTDRGLITCIDIRTGEVKYEGGRPPKPATFSASPIAFGGKLLLTSEDGDTFVIKAGPTFEVLAVNSLDEPVHASPAAAGGRLFIRTATRLYCIGV